MMKVSELIRELKKMPKDLDVWWADHDHSTYEVNNCVKSVNLVDKANMDEFDREYCDKYTPEKYVCLRP